MMDCDYYPDPEDSDFFTEENMERYFTDGDEQQEKPVNTNQDLDDSGHGRGDFA